MIVNLLSEKDRRIRRLSVTCDLVGAELKIKMNTHITCIEFYDYLLTKPDILKKFRSSDKYSHVAKMLRI